jgi:hypothetical protein
MKPYYPYDEAKLGYLAIKTVLAVLKAAARLNNIKRPWVARNYLKIKS